MESGAYPRSSNLIPLRLLCITFLIVPLLIGCNSASPKRPQRNISVLEQTHPADAPLFDVSISKFNSGTDEAKTIVFPEIRAAEAKYIPQRLKTALQDQKAWGAVRLVPNDYDPMDLQVSGEILISNGDQLNIQITVRDAVGKIWIKKTYAKRTSPTTYVNDETEDYEPFHTLYAEIANDLLVARNQVSVAEKVRIKTVSELRFAREFEPGAFDGYLHQSGNGNYEAVRLPAHEDPNLRRLREIRRRNSQFIDVLQIEYENFAQKINRPYYEWRKESYKENQLYRSTVAQSQSHISQGAVRAFTSLNLLTLFKLIANPTAPVGMGHAIKQIETGLDMRHEARMRQEGLRELATSLNEFVRSHNISIDERIIPLSGTVEERYDEFRRISREIYSIERPLDQAAN